MDRYLKASLFALSVVLAFAAGCDSGNSESSDQQVDQQQAQQQQANQQAEAESDLADVPDDGKEYDPAITTDQVPEGAWHCDMNGSVHYASMNEGDGECPVCGMDLVQ